MSVLNRKGDMFIMMLDIIFLVLIIFMFWKLTVAFDPAKDAEQLGTRQVALLNTYAVSEQLLLYLDETAKFAAYEAFDKTLAKGSSNQYSSQCKTYLGYQLWTEGSKECFPVADPTDRTSVMNAFQKEFETALTRMLAQHPAYPRGINYRFVPDTSNGLTIRGITEDKITLPIIAAKGDGIASVTPLLTSKNMIANQQGQFKPDATIPVTIVPSSNRKPRTETVRHIIIQSSQAESAEESIKRFYDGTASAHYLIDETGMITQAVPEDEIAYFSIVSCDAVTPCGIDGRPVVQNAIDASSIGIVLINQGPMPSDKAKCETAGGRYLARTDWQWCQNDLRGMQGCSPGSAAMAEKCYAKFTDAQLDALKRLVTDILTRREIEASGIKLLEQIRPASGNPGPAMAPEKMTEKEWFERMKVEAKTQSGNVKAQSATTIGQSATVPTASAAAIGVDINSTNVTAVDAQNAQLQAVWPMKDQKSIISCYGLRYLKSNDGQESTHAGLDITAPQGTPIYPIASGTVVDVKTPCDSSCDYCSLRDSRQPCPNAACKETCRYGNSITIKHSETLTTKYVHIKEAKVSLGQVVETTDIIALSGNTGQSEGPHLHLETYTGSPVLVNRVNPLCVLPESILQGATFSAAADSCRAKYKTPSHTDPQLAAECRNVSMLSSGNPCGVSAPMTDPTGNTKLSSAKQNLERLGVMQDIIEETQKVKNVDPRLIVAIITQESGGDPTILNNLGYAGLGQIGGLAYTDAQRKGVFSSPDGYKAGCKCSSGICHVNNVPACAGDERFDAKKNARASVQIFAQKLNHPLFNEKTDKLKFGIASYNWGEGKVRDAMKKAWLAKGGSVEKWNEVNPTWEETAPFAPKETQDYVVKVLGYYAALGGSTASSFSDITCDDVTVKEMGRYSFTPGFTVTVPNLLDRTERLGAWAKATYAACDGSGGKDNDACIASQRVAFSSGSADIALLETCDDMNTSVVTELMETIRMCGENAQSGCACNYTMPLTFHKEFSNITIELHGKSFIAYVGNSAGLQKLVTDPAINDAQGAPSGAYLADSKSSSANNGVVRLVGTYKDGKLQEQRVIVSDAGGKEVANKQVSTFSLYKTSVADGAWLLDTKGTETCGLYRTMHRVCADVRQQIPVLSKNTFIKPRVRFALDLKDDTAPEAVKDLVITSPALDAGSGGLGGGLTGGITGAIIDAATGGLGGVTNAGIGALTGIGGITFTFSAIGKDTSYYEARCAISSDPQFPQAYALVQGRDIDVSTVNDVAKSGTMTVSLPDCAGKPVVGGQCKVNGAIYPPGCYKVSITPVDLAGNKGEAAVIDQSKEIAKT